MTTPSIPPRPLAVAALLVLLAVTLTAQTPPSAVPSQADTDAIVHVLNRIGYGPRPGDVERVAAMGLDAYIEQQLSPSRISDAEVARRLAAFPTLTMTTAELAREYFGPALALRRAELRNSGGQPPASPPQGEPMMGEPGTGNQPGPGGAPGDRNLSPEQRAARDKERQVLGELMQARLLRAIESERQLEEVLVDFWFNHFNVFVGKGQVRMYLTEYERDAIRPYVLGSFRDMLGAVAESPAMLFYLDNFENVDPEAARKQAERIETAQARMAGRARGGAMGRGGAAGRGGVGGRGIGGGRGQAGGAGRQAATPEQREQFMERLRNRGLNENYARELLELHTLGVDAGYTQADIVAVARAFTGWGIDRPRDGGRFEFDAALHDNDPKVVLGTTIRAGGKKDGEAVLDLLAAHPATARFIATKLARRFVADEPPASLVDRVARVFQETKGDLRAVTRAVITSPEFFSAAARRAKVKTPLEFVASAVRATGATVTSAAPLVMALRDLGMPLYGAQPPTGWGDTAEDWVNTGALLKRMNLAIELASGERRAVRVDVRALAPDTGEASRDGLLRTLVPGEVSDVTRDTLAKAESPQHLVALALGSPEFQRR